MNDVLINPPYFAPKAHCLKESVFDDGRPRYVDYGANSGHCFCVFPRLFQNPREFFTCPKIILTDLQTLDIQPNTMKTGYDLTLRRCMSLAARQQPRDA
jgi:hypothetical protein